MLAKPRSHLFTGVAFVLFAIYSIVQIIIFSVATIGIQSLPCAPGKYLSIQHT